MTNKGITPALSAQERAIVDGKKVLHGTVTDRVLRMFDAIRSYGPPRVGRLAIKINGAENGNLWILHRDK